MPDLFDFCRTEKDSSLGEDMCPDCACLILIQTTSENIHRGKMSRYCNSIVASRFMTLLPTVLLGRKLN